MIKEYWLLNKDNIVIPVTIQQCAKEDFKQMMDWNEKQFKKHTCVRYKRC